MCAAILSLSRIEYSIGYSSLKGLLGCGSLSESKSIMLKFKIESDGAIVNGVVTGVNVLGVLDAEYKELGNKYKELIYKEA